jgi:hypothetical protein
MNYCYSRGHYYDNVYQCTEDRVNSRTIITLRLSAYDNKPRIIQIANDKKANNITSFVAPNLPGDFYNITI